MKQFIIIAFILIVSISAKAQKTEKPLPVVLDYKEALLISQYTARVDSLIYRSDIPTNKTAPLLQVSPLIRAILNQAYTKAVRADSLVTNKNKK